MDQEGDNNNDEYYVPIQNRSDRRIFRPNSFGQADTISPGLLTFQFNALLKNSRLGSIQTIKNELLYQSLNQPCTTWI